MGRKRKPRGGRWRLLALVILLAGTVWVGYVQWFIHSVERAPIKNRGDVGIVLGAALWNGEPSPGLRERLDHALQLYREGWFDRFIVTGGYDHPGAEWTEAEGMQRYLNAQGVPHEDIVLENAARSTYENLYFSGQIMASRGWEQAIIVTHSYHGARALDIAKFLDYAEPVVSVTDSDVMNMVWHKGRETLAFTKWQLDKLLIWTGWME